MLVLVDYYLPGYKAGGALRAISGLTDALGDEFNFMIMTSDWDCGDKKSYPGVQRNVWTCVGKAAVMYVNRRNPFSVMRHQLQTLHDVLYVKSFLSRSFSMLPMWMRALAGNSG